MTILSASAACGGSDGLRSPTGPTVTSNPPLVSVPSPVSPNAIPITLGQTVSGVVSLSDPTCSGFRTDPPEPCQRFAIATSQPGVLIVQVAAPGPSTLTLGVGALRQWGVTTVRTAAVVEAGSTYEIFVALHDAVGGNTSQKFELTTSYEPL